MGCNVPDWNNVLGGRALREEYLNRQTPYDALMTVDRAVGRILLLCWFCCLGASLFAQTGNGIHIDNAPALPQAPSTYQPITPKERSVWFVRSTVGIQSLTGGLFSAGLATATNSPHEYGPHWGGFGDRYGMRLTGISTGNAIEASLGAIWGEDPRYFQTVRQPFGSRVKNIVDLTFRAYRTDGDRHLAYARYAADFGNNFLSNTWRVPSESDSEHALLRSAYGISGRALSNTFQEFWPSVVRLIRRKRGAH